MKIFYVRNDEHKALKYTISYREEPKEFQKSKNRITRCITPRPKPIKLGMDQQRVFLASSNIWPFRSFHTNHTKQAGTRFHTSDKCFPNQFLQPNNNSATAEGITNEFQITGKFYSKEHQQHHSGLINDSLFPQSTNTYNSKPLVWAPSS